MKNPFNIGDKVYNEKYYKPRPYNVSYNYNHLKFEVNYERDLEPIVFTVVDISKTKIQIVNSLYPHIPPLWRSWRKFKLYEEEKPAGSKIIKRIQQIIIDIYVRIQKWKHSLHLRRINK